MIQFDQLQFSYDKRSNFCLGPLSYVSKKHILLTGSNGSGKTTLLKCIAGLLGVHNQTIKKSFTSPLFISAKNALPWQYITGFEHIFLFNKIHHPRAFNKKSFKLLKENLENKYPFLNKPCFTFSMGQISLTKTLAGLHSMSDLILLDEVDAHLDANNRQQIYDLIVNQTKKQKKLLIFSSHYLTTPLDQFERMHLEQGQLQSV